MSDFVSIPTYRFEVDACLLAEAVDNVRWGCVNGDELNYYIQIARFLLDAHGASYRLIYDLMVETNTGQMSVEVGCGQERIDYVFQTSGIPTFKKYLNMSCISTATCCEKPRASKKLIENHINVAVPTEDISINLYQQHIVMSRGSLSLGTLMQEIIRDFADNPNIRDFCDFGGTFRIRSNIYKPVLINDTDDRMLVELVRYAEVEPDDFFSVAHIIVMRNTVKVH